MKVHKERKSTGSKGFEGITSQDLARCGRRGIAGVTSPSTSDCYRIGTWNVRSLQQVGKLANTVKEMKRMNVSIMGVAETFWKGESDFMTELPDSDRIMTVRLKAVPVNLLSIQVYAPCEDGEEEEKENF